MKKSSAAQRCPPSWGGPLGAGKRSEKVWKVWKVFRVGICTEEPDGSLHAENFKKQTIASLPKEGSGRDTGGQGPRPRGNQGVRFIRLIRGGKCHADLSAPRGKRDADKSGSRFLSDLSDAGGSSLGFHSVGLLPRPLRPFEPLGLHSLGLHSLGAGGPLALQLEMEGPRAR